MKRTRKKGNGTSSSFYYSVSVYGYGSSSSSSVPVCVVSCPPSEALVAAEVAAALAEVGGLAAEVELGLVAAAQALDQRHVLRKEPARDEQEVVEVRRDVRRHFRVLHLDHHFRAVVERRAVRLRDGRRAEGRRVEGPEKALHRQGGR